MMILDKKFASGFISGIFALFTVISVLLMNPEQMRRWLLNNNSVDEKVERALTDPSRQVMKLKSTVSGLQEKLIQENAKSESRQESILEESKRLSLVIGVIEKERDTASLKSEKTQADYNRLSEAKETWDNEKKDLLHKISILEAKHTTGISKTLALENEAKPPKLKGKSAYIYFNDTVSEKAYEIKQLLERYGARTKLMSGSLRGASNTIIYYENTGDIGLALQLRDQMTQSYGFKTIKVKDWVNDDMNFTLFVE